MTEPVEIYRQGGDIERTIGVYLNGDGGVEMRSHDFPSLALRPFAAGGAGEYEYFTDVPAAAKDQLLIALLVEHYWGNPNAVEDFRRWCEGRGIPCQFFVWGSDYER